MNIYASKSVPYCKGGAVFVDVTYLVEDGCLTSTVKAVQISGLKVAADIETAISDAVLAHIVKHRKDSFDASNVMIL